MKTKRDIAIGLALGLVAIVVAYRVTTGGGQSNQKSVTLDQPTAMDSSLSAMLTLQLPDLERIDIARINLLCAQGLSGAEGLDINGSLIVLDEMAMRVKSETDRHFYRFRQNPAEFENSEGYYRMLMLAVVLAEDFNVKYAPDKIGTAMDARMGDGFFNNAQDVFLPGLTGAKHQGTCSSLPVLQVAVGRRLGYPLKLVTTKSHLFMRWEDTHERFNIEAAGRGVNRFSDDYYRHWPLEVSADEVLAEGYLTSLSPAGELAVFLSIRGMCFKEAKQYGSAATCFREAARLAPGCRSYASMHSQTYEMAERAKKTTSAVTQEGEKHP